MYVSSNIKQDAEQECLHSAKYIANLSHGCLDDSNHHPGDDPNDTQQGMCVERRSCIRHQYLRCIAVKRGDSGNQEDTIESASTVP